MNNLALIGHLLHPAHREFLKLESPAIPVVGFNDRRDKVDTFWVETLGALSLDSHRKWHYAMLDAAGIPHEKNIFIPDRPSEWQMLHAQAMGESLTNRAFREIRLCNPI